MKVSIITSCYNRATMIEGAIRSVFAQTHSDIEYIIVDGASKDGSLREILRSLNNDDNDSLRYDDYVTNGRFYYETKVGNVSVKVLSEPDKGMYEAINKGIRMATGDVIGLCHSDDFLFDDQVVADYVQEFERTGADFIYADGLFVDPEQIMKPVRRWIGGKYSKWKVRHGWLPLHPTCYITRKAMEKYGVYDESFKIAADSDLLVRYLLKADIKVAYMKGRFVTRMRMGGMSTDSAKRKKMWQEDIRVYSGHGFKHVTLTKLQKMAWKVPQFISAKFMK